jgi:preprotein translocase subunit SecD
VSRHLGWRLVAVLLLAGAAGWMVVTRPARLDLRGGTQIVLEAKDSPDRQVDGDTVARTLEVLRRRVDQLGVTEPTLQRSGERRVIVELPGVYDPEEAVEVIGRTAQLTFHPVLGLAEPAAEEPATTRPPADGDELVLADEEGGRLRLGPAALLAVIGYSVNDSVVVFDRIRERLRGQTGRTREPLARLANDACLQPIPRTVNTGLGAPVHPGRPVRPRWRHPDRLRPRPGGRDPGRDLLLGVRGHAIAGGLRAARRRPAGHGPQPGLA